MNSYREAMEETGGAFGILKLHLNSIELIYHQQFVLELVDYTSHGILGSLFATAPSEPPSPSPVLHEPSEFAKRPKKSSIPEVRVVDRVYPLQTD